MITLEFTVPEETEGFYQENIAPEDLVYSGSESKVITNLFDHKNVTKIGPDSSLTWMDSTLHDYGIFEFYINTSLSTTYSLVSLEDSLGSGLIIRFNDGSIDWFDGSDWNSIGEYLPDEFIHIKLEYNGSIGTDIYIIKK
ncbi:hypothetical protein ES708_10581 [subsurface metagenome]